MSLSRQRRFLNLIVDSNNSTVKSLRCIDLKRLQLFYPTPTPTPPPTPARTPAMEMETFGLPGPTPIFRACESGTTYQWRVACYPLARRNVLCTDQCGRNLLYDATTREVAAVPDFYRPRLNSLSLFIPSSQDINNNDDDDDDNGSEDEDDNGTEDEQDQPDGGGGGILFLMEKILRPVPRHGRRQLTGDLEVLVYGNGRKTSQCKLLPQPPNIHDDACSKIGAYAVVGNGNGNGNNVSHVCISVNGIGTYVLDTTANWHTWRKVGEWTLPFHGKAQYVPELKLWFGFRLSASVSAADGQNQHLFDRKWNGQQHLIAADLSAAAMDSSRSSSSQQQPRTVVVDGWQLLQAPEDWIEVKDPQLVSLGSGRFCVARFFEYDWDFVEQDNSPREFLVLTGLEVATRVLPDGEVKLEMIPHKSMRHTADATYGNSVDLVF